MAERIINVDRMENILELFGNYDENVNLIQREYSVAVLSRGGDIKITGDEENVFAASKAIDALLALVSRGEKIDEQSIRYVFSVVKDGTEENLYKITDDGICVTMNGRIVKPKTIGQKKYVDAIRDNTIVLGVGPAGTGKTYLAVAMAVKAFRETRLSSGRSAK